MVFASVRYNFTEGGFHVTLILDGSFYFDPREYGPPLSTLSELPSSPNPFMEYYYISGLIETALHHVRENVFLSCVGVLAIYSVASWVNSLQRRVSPQY